MALPQPGELPRLWRLAAALRVPLLPDRRGPCRRIAGAAPCAAARSFAGDEQQTNRGQGHEQIGHQQDAEQHVQIQSRPHDDLQHAEHQQLPIHANRFDLEQQHDLEIDQQIRHGQQLLFTCGMKEVRHRRTDGDQAGDVRHGAVQPDPTANVGHVDRNDSGHDRQKSERKLPLAHPQQHGAQRDERCDPDLQQSLKAEALWANSLSLDGRGPG